MTLSQPLFAAFVDCIAERHGVSFTELVGSSRKPEVVAARNEAFWHLRQQGYSYPAIGRRFGKHHTTVMHGVERLFLFPPEQPIDWAALEALVREDA